MPIKPSSVFHTLYNEHLKSITMYVDGRKSIDSGFPSIDNLEQHGRPPRPVHTKFHVRDLELDGYHSRLTDASYFLRLCIERSSASNNTEIAAVADYLDALLNVCFHFRGNCQEVAKLTALYQFTVNYIQRTSHKRLTSANEPRFFIDYIQTTNEFKELLSNASNELGRAMALLTKVKYDRDCADAADVFVGSQTQTGNELERALALSLTEVKNVMGAHATDIFVSSQAQSSNRTVASIFKTYQMIRQPQRRHESDDMQHIYDQHFGLVVRR